MEVRWLRPSLPTWLLRRAHAGAKFRLYGSELRAGCQAVAVLIDPQVRHQRRRLSS